MIRKWLARPSLDWLIASIGIAAVRLFGGAGWASVTAELEPRTRQAIYQTLTGVSGGLLGFFIATVAILLAIDSDRPRMRVALRGPNRERVHLFFFSGIRIAALVLVVLIAALVLDKGTEPAKWVEPVLVASVILGALRTSRIIWVLHQVVTIAGHDVEEAASTPP